MSDIKKLHLGASSIILGNLGGHTDEGFSKYSEAGIKYAELSLSHKELCEYDFYENPEKISTLAGKHEVKFWSFHVPFSESINPAILDSEKNKAAMDIIEKSVRSALEIGIKTIVIHPSGEILYDDTRWECFEKSTENLTFLSNICKENGAALAVENLPENCLGNSSFEIISYLNCIPDIGLCFDTSHLTMQTNEDFLDDLKEQGMYGRIRTIHASDYDFFDMHHALPGQGINDWNAIFSRLCGLSYDGVFMYEVSKHAHSDKPITLSEIRDNFENVIMKSI